MIYTQIVCFRVAGDHGVGVASVSVLATYVRYTVKKYYEFMEINTAQAVISHVSAPNAVPLTRLLSSVD